MAKFFLKLKFQFQMPSSSVHCLSSFALFHCPATKRELGDSQIASGAQAGSLAPLPRLVSAKLHFFNFLCLGKLFLIGLEQSVCLLRQTATALAAFLAPLLSISPPSLCRLPSPSDCCSHSLCAPFALYLLACLFVCLFVSCLLLHESWQSKIEYQSVH